MDSGIEVDKSLDFIGNDDQVRSKSSLRMTYEAEVKVFRSKFGGIEDIRKNLGLSRRKMCQLLMVDPSAWTRWMRDEDRVPPHIYRALEWYLALEKKLINEPGLATLLLKTRTQPDQTLTNDLKLQLEVQGKALRKLKVVVWGLALALLGLALIIVF